MARKFRKKASHVLMKSVEAGFFFFKETVVGWVAKLSFVRDGCNPKDTANVDEMGLFFVHCEVRLGDQKVKSIMTENLICV